MKLTQILKLVVIPVLSVFSLLSASNQALADYLTSQGSGGNYRYELWSTDDSGHYYLKVWSSEASADSDAYSTTRSFTSSRDALIYFDCNYAERSLPECSQ
ncbi:MAG: hypothetical protein RMZ41_016105 [Nostoc sp. DedVER02]|uniref:hypothetical protein n=1 Tax=unclassified Nostoc TaxID=2593658 RepID=UPI002AD2297F|nr:MULTISPECIES: hypothetical protein [unclassified Nostoc]MDZ7984681.1 hypothetical protein [Nostoc sp. DedVER02]MDZ8113742.1 hypothetical protein [Nostoc sp. DedVER01b]